MSSDASNRKTGTVVQIKKDYGFISSDVVSNRDIYFKVSWFQGSPPLVEGDVVTFDLRTFGENPQAYHITRRANDTILAQQQRSRPTAPWNPHLLDWAYLGYLPNILAELRGLCLPERWEFKTEASDSNRPFPILYSYLFNTFGRLVLENKVVISNTARLAAWNTGLVDPRYEPIFALFEPNDEGQQRPWQLRGFCIAGEDPNGQNLVRHFNPMPSPAHYFDHPGDLFYDTRIGMPELDWRHLVIERIDRYPKEFLEDHWPPGFPKQAADQMSEAERKSYYVQLGAAIDENKRIYRRIMDRVKAAVDLSIKRVSWNFKTAVPQYYPRVRQLQLLLPICLVSDECVDMALAVEKTKVGTYLGHTILALDWAYRNARLVCRPDSDWLEPEEIVESGVDEPEL